MDKIHNRHICKKDTVQNQISILQYIYCGIPFCRNVLFLLSCTVDTKKEFCTQKTVRFERTHFVKITLWLTFK